MYMYIQYVIHLAAVNLVHGTSESKSSPPLATMPFVIENDEMLLVLGSRPY